MKQGGEMENPPPPVLTEPKGKEIPDHQSA